MKYLIKSSFFIVLLMAVCSVGINNAYAKKASSSINLKSNNANNFLNQYNTKKTQNLATFRCSNTFLGFIMCTETVSVSGYDHGFKITLSRTVKCENAQYALRELENQIRQLQKSSS